MTAARTFALLGGLAFSVASCQVFFGVDEPPQGVGAQGEGGSGARGGEGPTGGGSHTGGDTGVGAGPVGCECVPVVPAGWQGPFLVYDGAAGEPFTCPDELAPSGTYFFGQPAGPATCSQCACQPPAATCSDPKLTCYGGSDLCMGSPMQVTPNNCNAFGTVYESCTVSSGDIVIGGQCVASGGEATKDGWASASRACVVELADHGGCESDKCAAADANGRRCIVQSGAGVPCPSGWDEYAGQRWTGENDTRGCSECGCGSPSGTCVGGSILVAGSQTGCDTFPAEVPAGDCWGLLVTIGAAELHDPSTPNNVGCPVVQATPQGQFDPANEVTVCCEPAAVP